MNAKVLILLALVAVAAAAPDGSGSDERSYGRYDDSYESDESAYDFSYQVKDDYGNDFGHRESGNGDHTEGEYYNELPDGRRQTVTYYVDGDSGFVADVKYSGEAHYDSGSNEYGYGSYSKESREYDSRR